MNLQTKQLHIRPIHTNDAKALYKYRSDPETYKYLSFIPQDISDVEQFIKKSAKEIDVSGTWFQFVILLKDTKSIIGDIGVHFLGNDTENKQVEIGYTLDRDFRNNGYATEALSAVIDYLFSSLNKHRITASIDPINKPSIQLIERLGFRKEAHFKKSLLFHGKWVDDLVYAILAKEWSEKS
ncbi:MAG: GNAT family protein [Brumimicrobium sp.]